MSGMSSDRHGERAQMCPPRRRGFGGEVGDASGQALGPILSVIISSSSHMSNFFNFRSLSCFLLCSIDFDANNIFKAFFGGPGGFSFEGE